MACYNWTLKLTTRHQWIAYYGQYITHVTVVVQLEPYYKRVLDKSLVFIPYILIC